MTDTPTPASDEAWRLNALELVLDGEPPYPKGSLVRRLQDERDRLRAIEQAK